MKQAQNYLFPNCAHYYSKPCNRNLQFKGTDLIFSHVDACDMSLLSNELAEHVAIPSTPTAEIKHPGALQTLGDHQTTAIVPERMETSYAASQD